MTQQFTASEVHERERFEEWYATHSFNYSRDPIGSRDCSLQWESWKAALAAHSAQTQPPAASVPDGLIDALRHQRQIDEDGAEVGVSRQAVDEAIAILTMLAAQENPNV